MTSPAEYLGDARRAVEDATNTLSEMSAALEKVSGRRDALLLSIRDLLAAWDEQDRAPEVSIRVTMAVSALRRVSEIGR